MKLPLFDYDALCCPHCRSTYLHHDSVDIFERCEDGDSGLHVVVSGGDMFGDSSPVRKVSIDESMDGNPSSRRHGIAIGMWCEGCHLRSSLTIYQHKGCTYVEYGDAA